MENLPGVLDALAKARGHADKRLHFAGDDDLGRLAVCDLLHGLDGLELQDLIVGGLLVQQLQRVGQRLLDGPDGLGFTGGPEDLGLLLGLGLEDCGLLFAVRPSCRPRARRSPPF